jgi:WD40 repeat protein
MIAFGRTKGGIDLLGPERSGKLHRLDWHTKMVNDLAFDPSGERLASAGDDGYAVVWDAHTGDRLRAIKTSSWVYRATFATVGDYLLISGNTGKPMTVWLDYKELKKVGEARATRQLSATECHRYVPKQVGCDRG